MSYPGPFGDSENYGTDHGVGLGTLWWACIVALVVLVVGCLLHAGNP